MAKSQLYKALAVLSVVGTSLSIAFTNCAPAFHTLPLAKELASSGTPDPVVNLQIDPMTPELLNESTPKTIPYSVTTSSSMSDYVTKCYLNSKQLASCSSPISLDTESDGDTTVRIAAFSKNGTLLSESSRTFRIDRQPPVINMVAEPSAQTSSTTATIQYTVTDRYSSADEIAVQCALDNAAYAGCTSPKSFPTLATGPHAIKLKAKDKAGNTSAETVISFSIIVGLPQVTITQAPNPYINTTSATFAFTGASTDSTIVGFECSIDKGVTYTACTSPKTYPDLTNKTYDFAVRSKDAVNQLSGAAMRSFTVDTVAPSVPTVTSNLTGPTRTNSLNLSFSATDLSGIASYQCAQDSGAFTTCTSPKPYTALASGTRTFRVKAIDQAGNTSTEGTYSIVIDTDAPVVNITSTPASSTSDTTASFVFTASDSVSGLNVTECQLDTEASYSVCSSPKNYPSVPAGDRIFSLRVSDKAGNSTTKTYAWNVAAMATPTPPPTMPTPTPPPTTGGGNPLTSIDTGTDTVVPVGDINMSVNGATVTVRATNRGVQTAAGVFDANDVLVRTLWRRVILGANQQTSMTWDYKDDLGQTVADGNYKIRALAHNVSYQWQGVIGNTSNPGAAGVITTSYGNFTLQTVGDKLHRAFHTISNMAIAPNGSAFTVTGYNEQQAPLGRFEISKPQIKTQLIGDDFQRAFDIVATDGTVAYFANTGMYITRPEDKDGIFDHPENFIVGVRLSDNNEHLFSSGQQWTDAIPGSMQWRSVIDIVADGGDQIVGLAVQTTGDTLFVAHKNTGIRYLNKTTGACKIGGCPTSIAVPSPADMTLDKAGNLWVIANNRTEVRKYTNPATAPALALTITGFGNASGLGVSPFTNTLVVVDSGSDQQIKAYNSANGGSVWVHGTKGGYNSANGPVVTPNKLNLKQKTSPHNFVAFEPSASEEIFWVGEPGNVRNLKFKIPANPAAVNPLVYMDQIMFVPASYLASADKGNPTRVFSDFLEFKVDYSKPITQSWTLAYNWDVGLPGYVKDSIQPGPKDVFTTPQGRTYALLVARGAPGKAYMANLVYELTNAGLRDTGVFFNYGARFQDGMNVRYSKTVGNSYQIFQRSFTGIDGSGNPTYSGETMLASAPLNNSVMRNPTHGDCAVDPQEETFPRTTSGMLITFDPCAKVNGAYSPNGFHLGGIKSGGTDFAFRASPSGAFKLDSRSGVIIEGDGTFNLDLLQQNYAGSIGMAVDRQVVYGYFGEFWNNGQSTQFMHFAENGLFLGQFGNANYPGTSKTVAPVGSAGNTFSPTLVKVDGNIYLYHNDESTHAGVHRYRMHNLSTIQEMVGNIGKNAAVSNPASIPSVKVAQ